jgi:hypothetical protein
MNDLMILSWNLEKKSLGAFEDTYGPDTLERIVKGVVDAVKLGDKAGDTPFVGFLHEIKGAAHYVWQMCRRLAAEYHKQTGKVARFQAFDVGGKAATAEWQIVMHGGVDDVRVSRLDVQESMEELVASDLHQAKIRAAEHDERVKMLRNRQARRYSPYGNSFITPSSGKTEADFERQKQDRYRDFRHEANWVRGGLIAEITHGAEKIKVASIHAPGPKYSDDKKLDIVARIVKTAANDNADILTGDFNKRGTISDIYYDDLTTAWTTGTSLLKKTPDVLSQSRWDRVFAKKGRTFNTEVLDPIKITRSADLGPRLTDHALIGARVSFSPLRNAPVRNNNNWENNNNWINNNNNWVNNNNTTNNVTQLISAAGTKFVFRLKSSGPPSSDVTSESLFVSSGKAENVLSPTSTVPVLAPRSRAESEVRPASYGEADTIIPSIPFLRDSSPRVESPLVTLRVEPSSPGPSAPPILETNSLAAAEKASSADSLLDRSSSVTADAFGSTVEARMLALKLPPAPTAKIDSGAEEEEELGELVEEL